MKIDELIYTFTQQQAGVTALVADRVYPALKRQDSPLPAIVYLITDTSNELNMAGPDNVIINTIEFSCMGKTYNEARAVFNALYETLHGFKGYADGVGPAGYVQGAWILDEEDFYFDDPKRYAVRADYRIVFCE